jgi:hypothetical protein
MVLFLNEDQVSLAQEEQSWLGLDTRRRRVLWTYYADVLLFALSFEPVELDAAGDTAVNPTLRGNLEGSFTTCPCPASGSSYGLGARPAKRDISLDSEFAVQSAITSVVGYNVASPVYNFFTTTPKVSPWGK